MRFTATEQTIFDALVRHSSLREEITLSAIADECHVAKSTVVKTVKKLGFEGFKDFVCTYRLSSSVSANRLLPENVVEGDLRSSVDILARHFAESFDRKNFIHLGGEGPIAPIARYVSRKLGMFDIFAPATYDYALMDHTRLSHGFAILFPRIADQRRKPDDVIAAWSGQISYFKQLGYHVILITDSDLLQRSLPADDLIEIAGDSPSARIDLFAVRVLMLFEAAFSEFAQSRSPAAETASCQANVTKSRERSRTRGDGMDLSERDLAIRRLVEKEIRGDERITISEVAQRLDVPRSAVYRVAGKLGYGSWSDFIDQTARRLRPDGSNGKRPSSKLEQSLDSMAATLKRNLDRIILIESCGDAEICREYLTRRLNALGALALPYSAETARAHADPQRPGMALIVNETGVMLWECCLTCAQEGYEVVAITAHDDSPVARSANWSITIRDNKSSVKRYEPNYFAAGVIAFMERAMMKLESSAP